MTLYQIIPVGNGFFAVEKSCHYKEMMRTFSTEQEAKAYFDGLMEGMAENGQEILDEEGEA